jgi:prepilin-type N-terminal cleavage/methylation domain-containing protein
MSMPSTGYTLVELIVVCCVLAILSAIAVPCLAAVHGRSSTSSAADAFAVVLRDAQARAWAHDERVRVSLTAAGDGFVVEGGEGADRRPLVSGSFGGARCTCNYPAATVEFVPEGFPHVIGGPARAGTFTFSCVGCDRSVVVQMGGAIRCR